MTLMPKMGVCKLLATSDNLGSSAGSARKTEGLKQVLHSLPPSDLEVTVFIYKLNNDHVWISYWEHIPSVIVAGKPSAHVWCSKPQSSHEAGWWICFHKEIMCFTPTNLSIYHIHDSINTWHGRWRKSRRTCALHAGLHVCTCACSHKHV